MLCWALRATFATIFDQMADYKQPNVIDLIHDRLILHDRICAGSSSLAKERRVLRTPPPLSFLKGECHKFLSKRSEALSSDVDVRPALEAVLHRGVKLEISRHSKKKSEDSAH